MGQVGDDFVIAGTDREWHHQGYTYYWNSTTRFEHAAYIYTDRPIYRPGHTVYFKTIVRNDNDAVLTNNMNGEPVTVLLKDARDHRVQTHNLTLNDYGTANGEFTIGDGASLGEYTVLLQVGDDEFEQIFKVEEYRKPDYEVTVTAEKTELVEGDTIEFTVNADYFLGEPLDNASVEIRTFQLRRNYNYW